MCFIHSDYSLSRRKFIQRVSVGTAAAAAIASVGKELAAAEQGIYVAGVGRPDAVIGAPTSDDPVEPEVKIDGFSKTLHNRFNQDLKPVATVKQGQAVQFLCRDALDIGSAAQTLTGPVYVEGAKPGDILEVEVLDVAPLVDFGYVVMGPLLGLFGSLRPEPLAPFAQFIEASELSDPAPGKVPSAIPEDQPYNAGAPSVQIFTFNKGQSTGFAQFVGKDTGKRAKIPIAPFMGVYGVAPLRKGMYRTVPPNVSGGIGGNADIKHFVKGARIQYPVYVEGAKFSVGDGHMAQGDGEICVTAVETLMAVTLSFRVIKHQIIESPRAIVPTSDPTLSAMTPEMREKGFYHTVGVGPDLMENAKKAAREMIDWLVHEEGLSLHEAYAICSVVGDLKISEVVDIPNWVVSMTVPRGIFERV